MRFVAIAVSLGVLTASASAQSFLFEPTTTLTAQTANNTSAPDYFAGQSNGNTAAGNVSKLPLRSLLYEGATTRIYAHFMPWFGRSNHLDVGYRSDDPVQVERQVTDMLSRGIDGAIIDWYGPDYAFENNATILLMQEIETRTVDFEFAVMLDGGSLNSCANTVGCSVTQRVIDYLNYSNATFQGSRRYMRLDGRPVVFFFGVDGFTIDWAQVRSGVAGNPLFIFRQSSGFSKTYSDGAFSWVGLSSDPNNEGLGYLDNFYITAKKYPSKYTFGSVYAGFNDSLAPWRKNAPRILNQKCGQTWLDTFARVGLHYSADSQLLAMQIVTWNDYEEGTEIESGIDNCVTVTAAVSGSQLAWNLGSTDKENTVHHYTVFISQDGEQLMSLGDVPSGTHTFDLSSLGLDKSITYTLYVKATGQPSLTNKMSNPVSYQVPKSTQIVACTGGSTNRSITICSPTANSSVVSPVRVLATATDSAAVTLMQVYLDGKKVHEMANTKTIDVTLAVTLGSHRLTVQARDSKGHFKQSINFTATNTTP